MKYILYTRCSTEEQKKGFSHEYQLSGLMSSPKLKDGVFIASYQDSVSGTTFDRPQLDTMYKYCSAHRGEVGCIFVYKWDRFGRDVLEAFQTIEKFRKIGVRIDCPDFSIDFLDTNWPVLLAVQMGIAQSESLKIGDRTRDGIYTAMKSGYYVYSAPVGYIRDFIGNHASIKPDPEKAPIVAKIFHDVANGAIAKQLYRTYSNRLNIRANNFYYMLRNKVYISVIDLPAYKHFPATTVKAKHQPIINLDTYNKVQHQLAINTRKTTSQASETVKLYAKGSIFHAGTGQLLTSYYARNKRGILYPYYELKGTKGSILNANRVHEVIDGIITRLTLDIPPDLEASAKKFFLTQIDHDKSKRILLEKEMIDQKAFQVKLQNDYTKGIITGDQFSKVHEKTTLDIADTQRQIDEYTLKNLAVEQSFKTFFEHLKNMVKIWREANETKKTSILKVIFPEGFTIDRETYRFRTPRLNKIVFILCSDSTIWDEIKTDLPQKNEASPLSGG